MLMGGLLTLGLPGCGDDDDPIPDDPSYEDVVPDAPAVTISTHGISGVVSAISGDPISGATVTASASGKTFTATTGEDGTYTINEVSATGAVTVTVSAEGKQDGSAEVSIPSDGKAHQVAANFVLANVAQTVAFTGEEQTIAVEVEKSNEVAEEDAVSIDLNVPAGAAEGEIELMPIYAGDENSNLRAAQQMVISGLKLDRKSDDAKINKAIPTKFNVGKEIAAGCKVLANHGEGAKEISFSIDGDNVAFDVDDFGSYTIVADIEVSESTSSSPISVSGSFDNLNGSSDLTVGSISYTYKIGGELDAPKGKAAAMLHSILSGKVNGSKVKEATGSYPLNLVLPAGTAASVSGSQSVTKVTVSGFGTSMSATTYGGVSISISTYNRNHNGGSVG